jgi:hypothetical protein
MNELYNYYQTKETTELQNMYRYASDKEKEIIRKCIESRIMVKDEDMNFEDNLYKFKDTIKNDNTNNKFQERINYGYKKVNQNNNYLGKRKNF